MKEELNTLSIRVQEYRCFKRPEQGADGITPLPEGIERIRPVNLVIGRNNAGKTALLEVIRQATEEKTIMPLLFTDTLTAVDVQQRLQDAPARALKTLENARLTWKRGPNKQNQYVTLKRNRRTEQATIPRRNTSDNTERSKTQNQPS